MYVSISQKTDRFDASSTLTQCSATASRRADLDKGGGPLTPVVSFPGDCRSYRKLSRRERTSLRDTAAYILQPEHGRGRAVCACGHSGKRTETVTLILKSDGTAGTLDTLRCGSPWLCADCAPFKANERLDRLQRLEDALATAQGKMASVTITVGHRLDFALRTVKEAIETASRKARQGAPWNRQKELHDVIGVLSAPEVTYSLRNGWHYHIHHAFLTGECGNPEELGHWFIRRYLSYLNQAGFTANISGQEVSTVSDPRRYISYIRKGPSRLDKVIWSPKGNDEPMCKSLHPFDILRQASGSEQMKTLWREYADVMPGTRSCVITRSIAVRLGICHDDDAKEINHCQTAGHLPAPIWAALLNRRKTNVVLSLLEDEGITAWPKIYSVALAFGSATAPTENVPQQEQNLENIPRSRFEHRPSAMQVAELALHIKWHLTRNERNGEAIKAALDRERAHAVAKGMAFIPPKVKDVLEIYGNAWTDSTNVLSA